MPDNGNPFRDIRLDPREFERVRDQLRHRVRPAAVPDPNAAAVQPRGWGQAPAPAPEGPEDRAVAVARRWLPDPAAWPIGEGHEFYAGDFSFVVRADDNGRLKWHFKRDLRVPEPEADRFAQRMEEMGFGQPQEIPFNAQRDIEEIIHNALPQPEFQEIGELEGYRDLLFRVEVNPQGLKFWREVPRENPGEFDFDTLPETVEVVRGMKKLRDVLTPFKPPYDSIDEVRRWLLNTIIQVHGVPFYVAQVTPKGGDPLLVLSDENHKISKVRFSDPGVDLRSPPPGYVNGDQTYYFFRKPERIYHQGLTKGAANFKKVGGQQIGRQEMLTIVDWLRKRENAKWEPSLQKLLQKGIIRSARLSDNFAVYMDKGRPMMEFTGRELGDITDNDRVHLGDSDFRVPWISEELLELGFEPARAV